VLVAGSMVPASLLLVSLLLVSLLLASVMPGSAASAAGLAQARSVPAAVALNAESKSGHAAKSGAASSPAEPLLPTPLLSPGRVPRALQAATAEEHLDANLASAMSPQALGATAADHSCAEVVQDGQVIYQDHADLPVVPASNMKLITATVLLDKLGPTYRFQTSVVTTSSPVKGVVHGNLYLVGGGDPLLRLPSDAPGVTDGNVYTNVNSLVILLKDVGVRRVTGSIVGDDARYDSLRTVPGWPARYTEEEDVGPLSALDIDDGFATAGLPLNLGAPPAVQAAGILTNRLRSAEVQVNGSPTAGKAPPGAKVLVTVSSAPLRSVLGVVLRESDDTAFELMTKELGYREKGIGSTAAGLAAIRADLAADGLPLKGFVNADGSGLSRFDRVTCALLVAVLERSGPDGVLVRDLPVAARSGTLVGELGGTAAAGRVYAKTGTLNYVKALSGWVEPASGQGRENPALAAPVAFATVLNDLPTTLPNRNNNPTDMTDQVALDIANYPQSPVLARFEP
jgi:serine-type D-Ala-D-Ala carboxypeptidase/endopeptidase (penicillin-binding protein 4)